MGKQFEEGIEWVVMIEATKSVQYSELNANRAWKYH